jgi:hypothetical protein
VAKLLCLSKRARPELLTAVTFLATRVACSTEEDWGKLDRVLRYLNSTPELGLVLQADKNERISMCRMEYMAMPRATPG